MSSITLRRCTVDQKTGKTMYDVLAEEAQALGDSNLGAHEIDSTFFRASPDPKGNIFYRKSDGTPFVASFIAEIGSEGQGTWMAAYYKKSPPAHKLLKVSSHGPRPSLPHWRSTRNRSMFRNGLAACDTIRGGDEIHEADNNERFDVTEWINGEEDARAEDMVLLVRLHPTYEVPYSSAKQESSPSSRTPRKRISKVGPAANPDDLPHSMDEVDTAHSEPTVPPSKHSDHWGPYFAHEKAELVQRDYTDKEGKLIAPEELYATLTEGTLVLVMVSLATYVIRDQKTEKGVPFPDKKIYHVLVDRLKVLDCGDAQPWNPPVPEMPEARVYSPLTPQRRARDDAADTAFNAFGLKSSPSPPKRARRAGTGSS
ncbi:hypothetical protein B0H10DRAFT_2277579 [Mycena sp. CBHHK59/15]|nr:hypothetical protein B0H10DRAFT_2277579 [Mycena sp. CBHHK59/15]